MIYELLRKRRVGKALPRDSGKGGGGGGATYKEKHTKVDYRHYFTASCITRSGVSAGDSLPKAVLVAVYGRVSSLLLLSAARTRVALAGFAGSSLRVDFVRAAFPPYSVGQSSDGESLFLFLLLLSRVRAGVIHARGITLN